MEARCGRISRRIEDSEAFAERTGCLRFFDYVCSKLNALSLQVDAGSAHFFVRKLFATVVEHMGGMKRDIFNWLGTRLKARA